MTNEKKSPKYEKPVTRNLDSIPTAAGTCVAPGNSPVTTPNCGFGAVADTGCGFGQTAQYCVSPGSGH